MRPRLGGRLAGRAQAAVVFLAILPHVALAQTPCPTPWPASAAAPGAVGAQCNIPVYLQALPTMSGDASAATQMVCQSSSQPCPVLAPSSGACFAIDITELTSPEAEGAYHMGFSLSGVSQSVQMFLTLSPSGVNATYPTTWAGSFSALALPTAGTTLYLTRDDTMRVPDTGEQNTRAYVCLQNTGASSTNFTLRGALHTCPFTFSDASVLPCSQPLNGTARNDQCSNGKCECKGAYAATSGVYTYPELGFDSCASQLQALNASSLTASDTAQPGAWQFWSFSADIANIYEVHASVVATSSVPQTAASTSTLQVFLGRQQPPSSLAGRYLAASTLDDWLADRAAGAALRRGDPGWPAAGASTWYVGVYAAGSTSLPYTLTVHTYDCPNNCGGAPDACNATSSICSCPLAAPTVGMDATKPCFIGTGQLQLGFAFVTQPRTFSSDRFTVNSLGGLSSSGAMSPVVLYARWQLSAATAAFYNAAQLAVAPQVLLGSGPVTSLADANVTVLMPKRDTDYTVNIPKQLYTAGTLYVTVLNALGDPYQVGYQLTITSAPPACTSGTYNRVSQNDGVCWKLCTNGTYVDGPCVLGNSTTGEYMCSSTTDNYMQAFSNGTGSAACGEPGCLPLKTPSLTWAPGTNQTAVCTRQCVCPVNATCSRNPQCDANTLTCSSGYQQDSNGQCVPVPTQHCSGTNGGLIFLYCLISVAVAFLLFFLLRFLAFRLQSRSAAGTSQHFSGYAEWDTFTNSKNTQLQERW